ncbi:MAG: rhomboid family intramembrane serine protease [Deltaproteobacteria bacterium]|nr:rhomboid family intramembrane serine protease [Deltaproteobacteria bacterium]
MVENNSNDADEKILMHLLASHDSLWISQCNAALQAEGIEYNWCKYANEINTPNDIYDIMVLDVEPADALNIIEILSEQLGEDISKKQRVRSPAEWVPLFLQPDFAFALCLALLLIAGSIITLDVTRASSFFQRGALLAGSLSDGQWWRLITAATLHADYQHAISNASFMLVLAWAASERLGPGVTLFYWLITAITGFIVGYLFSDINATVGASGGLFGLLGATGGNGLRGRFEISFAWRERMRIGGAAVLLLAFTAFNPESNIKAHVSGFISGLVVGFIAPVNKRANWLIQLIAGVASMAVVIFAWVCAR